jgi:hypothetical protein
MGDGDWAIGYWLPAVGLLSNFLNFLNFRGIRNGRKFAVFRLTD